MIQNNLSGVSKLSFDDVVKNDTRRQIFSGLAIIQANKKTFNKNFETSSIRTNYFGICLVKEGWLKVSINLHEHIIQKNTLFFLNPMLIVQFLDYSDDIELLGLFTESDFFNEIGLPIYKSHTIGLVQNDYCNFVNLTNEDSVRFESYFKNVAEKNIYANKAPFHQDIIKMTLMLLFYEISNINNNNNKTYLASGETKNKIVMDFLAYASKEFRTERSVQYYADQMHISRKHLSRVIKEVTGVGPKAIINKIIAAEALMLLNISTLSIKEIMYELNFSNSSTFSNFFKKHMGKSPYAYRQELSVKFSA